MPTPLVHRLVCPDELTFDFAGCTSAVCCSVTISSDGLSASFSLSLTEWTTLRRIFLLARLEPENKLILALVSAIDARCALVGDSAVGVVWKICQLSTLRMSSEKLEDCEENLREVLEELKSYSPGWQKRGKLIVMGNLVLVSIRNSSAAGAKIVFV